MASGSYCDASLTWGVKSGILSSITSFSFIDVSPDDDTEEQPSFSESQLRHDAGVHLYQPSEAESCCLVLKSRNPRQHLINGLTVISESRTLEISSEVDGYLATVRGQKINTEHDAETGAREKKGIFVCKCFLKEPYSSLSVKFLSLGPQTTLNVQRLTINIAQCVMENLSPVQGTLNLKKLKRDVDEMGDSVSDRAKDFLATVEQFEKNKLKTVGAFQESDTSGISGMISAVLGSKGNGESSAMPDKLSQLFAKLPVVASSKEDSQHSDMGGLISQMFQTDHTKNGTNKEDSQMYKMLQAVCGRVTEMRVADAEEQYQIDGSSASQLDTTAQGEDAAAENGKDGQAVSHGEQTRVSEKIEEVKAELHSEIQSVRQELLEKIDSVRSELGEKMDMIIKLLSESKNIPDDGS